ncbi:MAG TPA: trehalose-6-phosphate synthase [Salinisphaeraceae bacterium]|nr:trehalose-6-phosphate synthase [Salinisphaeraceae bacterium]
MSSPSDARLVVVSNRVAVPRSRQSPPGGLAVALRTALNAQGGIWFGWDGHQIARHPVSPQRVSHGAVEYVTLSLSHADYNDYYQGFANRVLWPLLHYRLGLLHYQRRYYEAYRRVNAWFAQHLKSLLRDDDVVWIHDYHFVPMAEELRARGFRGRIGFFLHTPFPPFDILRALPPHNDFLRLFMYYDLVGFQTDADQHAFIDSAQRGIGAIRTGQRLACEQHRATTGAFPIGSDADEVARLAAAGRQSRRLRAFAASLGDRHLIVGADRLDYSKGLLVRCAAYRHLLARHQHLHGDMVYLKIAEPSRGDVAEYQTLHHELDRIVGKIIGEYARFDWAPIRYISQHMHRATLLAFFSLARVALITPLRDGMNLVAKEFIAAQDPANPGVLILSEMAGAACELQEALLVNPYDMEDIADATARALAMPLGERRRRWEAQFETVKHNNVFRWSRQYLDALQHGS